MSIMPDVITKVNACRGYTLVSPVGGRQVHLIDMKGKKRHSWLVPSPLGGPARLLPNGNLLFAAGVSGNPLSGFEGATGRLIELSWEGNPVWEYEDPYMHHDFYRTMSGNTLILKWVETPGDIANKVKGGLPGTEENGVMWSDSIQEIGPLGEVLWEWNGYEHLDLDSCVICPLCFRNKWTGASSLDVSKQGDILVSFTASNSIVIISKGSKEIIWQWGGFLKLAHPKDVAYSGPESVVVMGNSLHGNGFERGFSEIVIVNTKTDDVVWEFRAPAVNEFYAPCVAGFQLLENGNILVSEGDTGHIFEISNTKEVVWEFINPLRQDASGYGKNNMVFRAYRYGPDFKGLKGNTLRFAELGQAKQGPEGGVPAEKDVLQSRLASLGY